MILHQERQYSSVNIPTCADMSIPFLRAGPSALPIFRCRAIHDQASLQLCLYFDHGRRIGIRQTSTSFKSDSAPDSSCGFPRIKDWDFQILEITHISGNQGQIVLEGSSGDNCINDWHGLALPLQITSQHAPSISNSSVNR